MAKDKKLDKILRIGIVQGGRIIEERLLRHKEAITIGQSPKNKFMVPSPRVPVAYTLVDVKGGGYVLCFEKGMLGKVLVGEEVLDLKTIATRKLANRKDTRFFFPITDESRGKIVLGDVTVLFQFVTPPPEVPKLQLPAEAKGAWWRSIDSGLLAALLVSFLMLGGSGGGLDVWWRQTGRYLARAPKTNMKIFQTLVKASVQAKEQKDAKKDADSDKAKVDKGIREDNEEKDKEAPRTALDEAIGEAENTDLGVGDQDLSEEELDAAAGGAEIDVADVADRVRDSFKEPTMQRGALSDAERMDRAKMMVTNRTAVGIMGSVWGDGEGAFGDNLAGGIRKIKDGSTFGTGTLDAGPGGLTSAYGEEGGLGEFVDRAGGPGEFGPGGPGGPGPGSLLALKPGELGPDKGPSNDEVIKGVTKKLEAEKPKVVEKKFSVNLDGLRGVVGGKVDKQAVNKYLRARSSAFQKCFTMAA
ncbi:MAG: hypothetical protein FJ109_09680, partial [Deltaproteobacteria bacterium]|nr:hypothetical protein [Deltaproteobacteria bacterium]